MNSAQSLPAPEPALENVLKHPGIWRGRTAVPTPSEALTPSGFTALDQLLRGGWPRGQLIELAGSPFGCGETGLLLPLVRSCTQEQQPVILVAPPALPWLPGWLQHGVDPRYLLLILAHSDADALWSSEQILQDPSISAVLLWLRGNDPQGLRRLRLSASRSSTTLSIVYRPETALRQASAAHLRIGWQPAQRHLRLALHKQTGHWSSGQHILIPRLPSL